MTSVVRKLTMRERATQTEKVIFIDGDFAPCKCKREVRPVGPNRDEMEHPVGYALLRVVSLRRHVVSSGLQKTFRCLECRLVWLVWRTDAPMLFWPSISKTSSLIRVTRWPPGFRSAGVVSTGISACFVARLAVLVDNPDHNGCSDEK